MRGNLDSYCKIVFVCFPFSVLGFYPPEIKQTSESIAIVDKSLQSRVLSSQFAC